LSLAAERVKAWYDHPQKCRVLCKGNRQTRSERREAYQIIIEAMLSMLDLASLCLGTPTLDNGFVDVPMKRIVEATGMSQRRCERAIADLKEAGLMEVRQPRRINEQGKYVGLRAVRVIRAAFFEFLNLGPMLEQERARATERLRRRAQKANRKLTDMMRRACHGLKRAFSRTEPSRREQQARMETSRRWNLACGKLMLAGVPVSELRQRVNAELGLPPDFSPGVL
jgi:DNA-binding transcriptional ArsR family regulator